MGDSGFEFSIPTCSNVVADITKNSTIVEEGPRICPLCNSLVRMFYIHYTSKIFMCENMQCEYPFGEDFTIYESEDDDAFFIPDQDASSVSKQSKRSNKPSLRRTRLSTNQSQSQWTGSEVSTSEWSDLARLNQAYDSDDSLTSSNIFTKRSSRHMEQRAKKQENEAKIKENVEKIKELNKVLFAKEEEDSGTIRNEKWIKNLSSMQASSGMKLVKEQELEKLKKTQDIPMGELKIDIENRTDSMSSIKIQIGNIGKRVANGNKK